MKKELLNNYFNAMELEALTEQEEKDLFGGCLGKFNLGSGKLEDAVKEAQDATLCAMQTLVHFSILGEAPMFDKK